MRQDSQQLQNPIPESGSSLRSLPGIGGRAWLTEAERYAASVAPFEACGIVDIRDDRFIALENTHEDPENHFRFAASDWERFHYRAQAVVHSHPGDSNAYPSAVDMFRQIGTGLPWVILHRTGPIVWGVDDRAPLVGRGFLWGIRDCYSLIRDHYLLELGIRLPDFARSWNWWNEGQDLYSDHFADAGFSVVESSAIRPGDVVLFRIRSKVANHGAVYLGHDTILHHPAGRLPVDPSCLSSREPAARYSRYIDKVVRYRGPN